mgnify:CR=1 FL=1
MKLELESIEGEKVFTEEEKERLKRRTRPISPFAMSSFSNNEKQEIKNRHTDIFISAGYVDYD